MDSEISSIEYACCICKGTIPNAGETHPLNPCAINLVSNFDHPRENQKEQQFFCHFECFRKMVNDDGIMYIMDGDFPSVGEIEQEEDGVENARIA